LLDLGAFKVARDEHNAKSPVAFRQALNCTGDGTHADPQRLPRHGSVEAARSRAEVILNLVRRDRPTPRQSLRYLAGARGHFATAGTPEQIAELMEDWFIVGAAEGLHVMPLLLPAQLDGSSAEVIPLLQRRGLFRMAYGGKILRERYGLVWPRSVFDEATVKEGRST